MALWLAALTLFAMLAITKARQGRSPGMYRSYALLGGCAALGIAAVPNSWLQVLLALMLLNLLLDDCAGSHLLRAAPLYLCMFAALVLYQQIGAALVWYGLLMLTCAGLYLSGYTVYQLSTTWHPKAVLDAGQENPNNLQAISTVCLLATLGLTTTSPWWWLAVLPVAFPIVAVQVIMWREDRGITMGPIILLGAALFLLPLIIGWWSLLVAVPACLVVLWGIVQALRHEKWWDSGRIRTWAVMLTACWLKEGWKAVLFGKGWQSWQPHYDLLCSVAESSKREHLLNTKVNLGAAHNEYVQILFEHGLLSFVALAGYIATSLWRLGHGSLEAQAVYLVAVGLCGVAFVLHPWTAHHGAYGGVPESDDPEKPGRPIFYTMGSPALNWMSVLLAVMVEVAQ